MLKTYKPKHEFKDGKRFHKVGEKLYPGVTTILSNTKSEEDKKGLQKWRDRVGEEEANKITKTACDNGSRVHGAIEAHLEGKPIVLTSETLPLWNSIAPILKYFSTPLLIEGALWNHQYQYAGSVDFVGVYKGQLVVCDWKTSRTFKRREWVDDYFLQLAAYRLAVDFVYGFKPGHAVCAIARANNKAHVFELDRTELDIKEAEFLNRVEKFYGVEKLFG